jgi:heptosyltransferase-2
VKGSNVSDTRKPGPAGESGRPILVLGYRSLGDFVRCHSGIRLLAARFPGSPIDVVSSEAGCEAARFMPHVRKRWSLAQRHNAVPMREILALARRLRGEGYGMAFVLPGSIKAASVPFLAGIPQRIGYPDDMRIGLVNRLPADWRERYRQLRRRKPPRMVDELCRICCWGGELRDAWPEPQLVVPPDVLAAWRRVNHPGSLQPGSLQPGSLQPGSLHSGSLHPGAPHSARPALAIFAPRLRAWPIEQFVAVARSYAERGWAVWVVGHARERPAAAAIRAAVPQAVDLTSTSLADAICQLAAASAVFAFDGGLSHVAAALGTPTVIANFTIGRDRHGPINAHVLHLEPPAASTRGLAAISVERVCAAIDSLTATAVRHLPLPVSA